MSIANENYRIRIRIGADEIEVESTNLAFVEAKITELGPRLGIGMPSSSRGLLNLPTASESKPVSLVEYVQGIDPQTGPQYVLAIGSFLERQRGMSDGFKTRDVVDAFQTIKFRHSNPAEAVRQAKAQGLVMDARESGGFVLTQKGESWIRDRIGVPQNGA